MLGMRAGSAQSVVLWVVGIGFSGSSRLRDMHMLGTYAGSAQSVALEVVGGEVSCSCGLCDIHMLGMCAGSAHRVRLVLCAVEGVVAGVCACLVGVQLVVVVVGGGLHAFLNRCRLSSRSRSSWCSRLRCGVTGEGGAFECIVAGSGGGDCCRRWFL